MNVKRACMLGFAVVVLSQCTSTTEDSANLPLTASTTQAPVQECDRLAAHPYDRKKAAVPGVFTIPPQAAQKAVDACLAAARAFQKEPRFDYQLARAYLAAGDTMEANRFFLDAIRFSTSPAAFGTYGRIREIGQIGRNRPDIAARYYQGGYRRGDVIAKLHLARLYHFGIEVKRNCRAADAFYRELESEGFSAAQFGLGQIYSEGLCRPVDHSVAFNWYLKSANAGYKPAAKAVAIAYRLGRGTEKNLSEFKRWSSKAGD